MRITKTHMSNKLQEEGRENIVRYLRARKHVLKVSAKACHMMFRCAIQEFQRNRYADQKVLNLIQTNDIYMLLLVDQIEMSSSINALILVV